MPNDIRPTLSEHRQYLLDQVPNERLFTSERYYESYLNGLTSELKNGLFSVLIRRMSETRYDYADPSLLFLSDPTESNLTFKPLSSVFEKLYRLNVLRPKKWPPPDNLKAISLTDFHETIDDLFRTRFICKYLDGPEFVCQNLKFFCDQNGIDSNFRDVTTNLGYHAWHFYFRQPIEDFGGRGAARIWVELQFTTQLAEVISSLTHRHYQSSRLGESFDEGWRWNVNSKQFRPYYIAHGLHLLEGVILEFRNSLVLDNRKAFLAKDEDDKNE